MTEAAEREVVVRPQVDTTEGAHDRAGTVRVLYVAGWGRSGSTLLARMIGELSRTCFVGELRDLWQRGLVENRLCGCGEPFRSCPFWSAVGQDAFGGWDNIDAARMIALRGLLDRAWSVPLLMSTRSPARFERRVAEYVAVLDPLYRALDAVSGGATIVDSSKFPSYALILRRLPSVDVALVHLVRDSRGTVYSWQKTVVRPDTPGRREYMIRYRALAAALRYVLYNGQAHGLRRLGLPYHFLRYEDLLAAPAEHLAAVARFAGLAAGNGALSFIDGRRVALGPSHTVIGNPMRLDRGDLELRLDDEWQQNMPRRQKLLVSAATSPLLIRYRYPVVGR